MKIIDKLKFDAKGLIPVVTADAFSGRVLMQAYADKTALEKTLTTKFAHYFSRSRGKLWEKGETSGNVQAVVSVTADCDFDCVLYRVKQTGNACHTGASTCFFNTIAEVDNIPDVGVLLETQAAIEERKKNPAEGSYTNYLLDKGREKICKKICEESGETVIAAMKGDNAELCEESADLLYHLLVLLNERGTDLTEVLRVLQARREKERKRDY